MNATQIYNAIQSDNREGRQQALFGLLHMVQTLSMATLELAGDVKLKTGRDPLQSQSRLLLTEFIELPKERT